MSLSAQRRSQSGPNSCTKVVEPLKALFIRFCIFSAHKKVAVHKIVLFSEGKHCRPARADHRITISLRQRDTDQNPMGLLEKLKIDKLVPVQTYAETNVSETLGRGPVRKVRNSTLATRQKTCGERFRKVTVGNFRKHFLIMLIFF